MDLDDSIFEFKHLFPLLLKFFVHLLVFSSLGITPLLTFPLADAEMRQGILLDFVRSFGRTLQRATQAISTSF